MLAAQAGWSSGLSQILVILGIALAVAALLVLLYSLWARQRRPLYANRYARNALILFFVAAIFGLGAWLTRPGSSGAGQLAGFSGQKPPLRHFIGDSDLPDTHLQNLEPSPVAPPSKPPPVLVVGSPNYGPLRTHCSRLWIQPNLPQLSAQARSISAIFCPPLLQLTCRNSISPVLHLFPAPAQMAVHRIAAPSPA